MVWDNPSGAFDTVAYSSSGGGFAGNGTLVVRFTTPAVPTPPSSGKGSIGVSEYQDPPTPRSGSLSTQPCDFTVGLTGAHGLSTVFAGDIEPIVYFTLGYVKSGYIELQPSTTYYLNVNNYIGSTLYCTSGDGTCNVLMTLYKQPGT